MYCAGCGAKIDSEDSFCANCGAKNRLSNTFTETNNNITQPNQNFLKSDKWKGIQSSNKSLRHKNNITGNTGLIITAICAVIAVFSFFAIAYCLAVMQLAGF